jgi:hypothetical protein
MVRKLAFLPFRSVERSGKHRFRQVGVSGGQKRFVFVQPERRATENASFLHRRNVGRSRMHRFCLAGVSGDRKRIVFALFFPKKCRKASFFTIFADF